MVATPFFENDVSQWALPADAVADAVMYAVSRPKTVDVSDIMVRPILQPE
jgi:NADP-dependent 3-hydroxy acid dehydrogenase YdfG